MKNILMMKYSTFSDLLRYLDSKHSGGGRGKQAYAAQFCTSFENFHSH